MKIAVLIVAAGRGHRAGGPIPKQYQAIVGETILRRAIKSFIDNRLIDNIKVVIHPNDQPFYDDSVGDFDIAPPCFGGETRQASVRLGLEALADDAPDLVLIHDAARPFTSNALIDRVIEGLSGHNAVIPALPVTDTIKVMSTNGTSIKASIDRDSLRRAQTPQGFHFATILEAHRALADTPGMTDDASIAEHSGIEVHVVDGEEGNIKVTSPEDLLVQMPHAHSVRTGMGYDVHRLGPGDHVMLCGVRIEHDQALIGHSDADVALHALTDALLGAVGAGDIGRHFPPSDDQWKGAPSRLFVEKAVELIVEKGGRIGNVDITIICEAPKVTPHVGAMTDVLSPLLQVAPDQINIKATTTEKLGFTGRGEGIAAQAVATVMMPEVSS